MKHLLLMRHAKSSWDHPGLKDFDRPLNKRGLRDAPVMGERLHAAAHSPDLIVSSPAVRARTTAEIVAEKLGYESRNILFDPDMYLADTDELLGMVRRADEGAGFLMMFGHNPGFTEFANLLTGEEIENVPTAGVVHIEFQVKSWREVVAGAGTLLSFDYPKREISPA